MTSSTDADTHAALADLRIRVLNNEPVSATEYRDLLMDLRRNRVGAAAASSRARATAKRTLAAPTLDINTLFGGPTDE